MYMYMYIYMYTYIHVYWYMYIHRFYAFLLDQTFRMFKAASSQLCCSCANILCVACIYMYSTRTCTITLAHLQIYNVHCTFTCMCTCACSCLYHVGAKGVFCEIIVLPLFGGLHVIRSTVLSLLFQSGIVHVHVHVHID